MKKKKSNKENILKKTILLANSETQPANCRWTNLDQDLN